MRKHSHASHSVACILIASLCSPSIRAQALDEIVVTATKRDTSLQSTAMAITAFTGDDLDAGQISGLSDLSGITPGLFVGGDNSLGSSPVAIRGIGSLNLSVGADEGVGIYVDGVYQGKPFTNQFSFIDVDSIEVLRGPQGTLYGRNATGGAIVIHTLTPGPEVKLKADASLTNLNGYQARFLLSGPVLEDRLYGKIAAGHAARDGYSFNPTSGELLNDMNNTMFTGALRWAAPGDWDVTLRGYHGKNDASFAYKNALDALPVDVIPATEPNESTKRFSSGTLNVTGLIGNSQFTSVTGYTRADTFYLSSSANVGLTQVLMDPIGSRQWYQELRLASSSDSAFSWIVGANYYRETAQNRTNFVLLFLPLGLNFYGDLKTSSRAGFVELGYQITDLLKLTAGARYTVDDKQWHLCNAAGAYTNLSNLTPGVCDGLYENDEDEWDALTPRLVLEYQWTEDVFGYVSVTKGFRSGGWNFTEPVTGPEAGVDPEEVWSYEVGVKGEFFARRLRANASMFAADYSDLQVRSPDPVTTLFSLRNAATARINGLEVELLARPGDSSTLSATITYLDATYSDYAYVIAGSPVDNGGNHLNNAPEWQVSLDAEHEFALPNGGSLMPRLELRYVSDVYFTEANQFPYGGKAHETINLRLQYLAPSGTWGFRLFADNLTNQREPTYAFEGITPDIVGVMIPPPRLYGGQMFYSFR